MTRYGYTGKVLRINLSDRTSGSEETDPKMIEQYMGGAGFGAKILNDENPDNIHWSDPENRMIIANGPLTGSPFRSSANICIVTKSPMTHTAVSSQANGYAGAWLKSCGYDAIVIKGCADEWSYLYVSEETVEIRNAKHLLGVDALDTQDVLKEEVGVEKDAKSVSVYCIGPAGENQVRYSMIIGDGTHTASKGGVGAVMGAKKLKAFVICRGKQKPMIHDRPGLVAISKELHIGATETFLDGSRHKWGTNGTFSGLHKVGALPVKNYTTNIFPPHEKMNGQYVRTNFEAVQKKPCFNCGINHIYDREVSIGPFKGFVAEEPEYEAFASFGPQIGQSDAGSVFYLTDLADRLGIDLNEVGWAMGWVMECVEKGLLTAADVDGLDFSWGNVDTVKEMMIRISQRKGFGNLLAEGVKRAAEKVGGEALNMAVYTMKGSTPRTHDHRARWHELVDTCMTNTSTLEATFVGVRPHLMGMPPVSDPFSPWEVPLVVAYQNGWAMIEDCLGACRFNMNYPLTVIKALNCMTGRSDTIDDILKTGKRIVNTLRLFNIRNGLTPAMEAPSERYGSGPVDGPAKGRRISEHWDTIRKVYYMSMGWDTETGAPLPDTLKALDLW